VKVAQFPRAERGEEVRALMRLDASGAAALLVRPPDGDLIVAQLDEAVGRATIGRHSASTVCLWWDREVSRTHAVLERLAFDWWVVDDGLSRNGTYVNGRRLIVRHRLMDGDVLRIGATPLAYHHRVQERTGTSTARPAAIVTEGDLTPAQLRVLRALCRPYQRPGGGIAAPAPNQQIADELVVSLDAVKTHMRSLFDRFGVEDLPQNAKRARVVELAFAHGLVRERDR
jgi:hypothetical protein